MEAIEQRDVRGTSLDEDRVYGELQVIARRLERIERLAGALTLGQTEQDTWDQIREQCAVASGALATASTLVPVAELEVGSPLREVVVRDLRLDVPSRQAWFGREPVPLANQEYELLSALARDPFKVHAKADLLKEVWGYRATARTRTVDSHASRLRRKLLATGAPPEQWVVNVWGVGYALLRA